MTSPLITVLITTYNYGQFIEQAIDSVLSQSFDPSKVQILVVDDGSSDDTSDRAKRYGSRVEYIYKPNGGQASALNHGINEARGEVIVLLDADDYFLPGKLRRVSEAFQRDEKLGLVYHKLQEWRMETGERHDWPFEAVSGELCREPNKFFWYLPQPTSAIALRRSCLAPLLPIPECIRMLADSFLASLVPFLAPVLAIPECFTVYRIHGNNSYSAAAQEVPPEVRQRKLEMWRVVAGEMQDWLRQNGFSRKEPAVRSLMDRWKLYQESEEFKLGAPGRLRFFRHLMLYNRCYGPYISTRLRLISYMNTAGALFTGYTHFHVLDKLRERATSRLRGFGSVEPNNH